MDLGIIISIFIGLFSLIIAFILEGGALSSLAQPTAALIVFGGTIGAIGISFPSKTFKNLPKVIGIAFKSVQDNRNDILITFRELSYNTRKNGLLSLESELSSDKYDSFTKKALQMTIDGTEPATVRMLLENSLSNSSDRHENYASVFDAAEAYAPTMGIIGTVMGLVQVLGNLSKPDELGPKIAVAFIATLYGVASANLLWLPFANKLKELDRIEIINKSMIIEAVLLLQEGASPKTLTEKLQGFLDEEISFNE